MITTQSGTIMDGRIDRLLAELNSVASSLQAAIQYATKKDLLDMEARLSQKLNKMAATLDSILTEVTDESTVDDSIIALLTGIKAQLDAVLAGALTPAQQAKADAIFAQVEANIKKVSDAVTANTPAA